MQLTSFLGTYSEPQEPGGGVAEIPQFWLITVQNAFDFQFFDIQEDNQDFTRIFACTYGVCHVTCIALGSSTNLMLVNQPITEPKSESQFMNDWPLSNLYRKFSVDVNGLVLCKEYIWTNVFKHPKVASSRLSWVVAHFLRIFIPFF